MAWVIDLDGVMWRGDEPIHGSAAAVTELRARGQEVFFITNNSSAGVGDHLAKLRRFGVDAGPSQLITSAQAAATLVEPGSTVLVCGGPGVEEALDQRDVRVVREGRADAVVVGWDRAFDFSRLTAAFRAVVGGARLIGTNDDATYPSASGALPGGGSILAAVAYAAGVAPEIAGKPNDAIVRLLQTRSCKIDVVVGDRPSTDGVLARRLGSRFALVLTGVTTPDHGPLEPEPDVERADLATLVRGG